MAAKPTGEGERPVARLEGPWRNAHGRRGDAAWDRPRRVVACDEEARPGYNSRRAHEYLDEEAVLAEKVRLLAGMIRRSKHCVAYTGAGLSTSAGIGDYASKSKDSLAKRGGGKKRVGFSAKPAYGHRALVSLFKAGHLKHWVQQNHDGLPQKAGMPQESINEIHGAWYDPSNPVVPMSGSLRDDLLHWLEREEEAADLCLALGTSLCGMNADRMVTTPAEKACRGDESCLGSVIVSIQETVHDDTCALRIFAKLDDAMQLLLSELALRPAVVPTASADEHRATRVLRNLAYGADGLPDPDGRLTLDLSPGARLQLVRGPGDGYRGSVVGRDPDGNVVVAFPCTREGHPDQGKAVRQYKLGWWMVGAAAEGRLRHLPVVNPARAPQRAPKRTS